MQAKNRLVGTLSEFYVEEDDDLAEKFAELDLGTRLSLPKQEGKKPARSSWLNKKLVIPKVLGQS